MNALLKTLVKQNLEKTPEGVALWLAIRRYGKDVKFPKDCWYHNDPLRKHERTKLMQIMRTGSGSEQEQISRASINQTRLTFAWDALINEYLRRLEVEEPNAMKQAQQLKEFWIDLADNLLFADSASPERKALGLQFLANLIEYCPTWAIPTLLSPRVVRCIVNQRSGKERLLHQVAKLPLDRLCQRVRKEQEHAPISSILRTLIVTSEKPAFDQATSSNTIASMLQHANSACVKDTISLVEDFILHPGDSGLDPSNTKASRPVFADMFLNLIRMRKVAPDEPWVSHLLEVLLKLCYFQWNAEPALTDASRAAFRSRLMSCTNHLITESRPYIICQSIVSLLKNLEARKELKLLLTFDANVRRVLERAFAHVNAISNDDSTLSPVPQAFICLYALTILQVFNEDPDAVSMLEEIETAYQATIEESQPLNEAFDLLMEVLLSMVSKPSALYRKVAQHVFTAFAPSLTAGALQSMLAILSQKETSAGQRALFDQNGDGEIDGLEEDFQGDIDGLEASDVEVLAQEDDDEKVASISERSEESEGFEGSEVDVSDTEDQAQMERLDASLGELLKTGRSGAEEEATDDESMDDEQMMALEPHLTKIFQERQSTTSKKKENQDAKETMINFKNRVLDFVTIYVKEQHSNPIALEIILPLLQLIWKSSSKQISEKASDIIRQYVELCRKKRGRISKIDDTAPVWQILETVFRIVAEGPSKTFQNACSRISIHLIKLIALNEGGDREATFARAQDLFADLQKRWMLDAKVQTQPLFFVNWLNWCTELRKGKGLPEDKD
jgi:DNA polymerase phi